MEKGRKRVEAEMAKVVAEARSKAEWEAAQVIAEAKQRAVQIISEARDWLQMEIEEPARIMAEAKPVYKKVEEKLEPQAEVEAGVASTGEGDEGLYQGMLELEIAPVAAKQIPNFLSNLQRVPNLQVVSFKGSATGESIIVVIINRPLPLSAILNEMPLVESAIANGNKIQVTLRSV